jgi:dihydrolipoamide dehydrogenase
MADHTTQLAVIGGGPGGYAAAFLAADMGMSVALVEPEENPGGACLYRGCIPSKALLHVAKLIFEAREASAWGLTFGPPEIHLDRLRTWKSDVVSQLTNGLGQLVKQRKVNHIRAKATFMDATTLALAGRNGEKGTLTFENAIVATGSTPVRVPGFDEGSQRVWYSKQALELEEIPKKLLVVGGGYIGLELGSVYAALGSEVTVAEMMPNLLPGVDRELVRYLKKQLSTVFSDIHLETVALDPKEQKNGMKVTLKGKKGASKRLFDRVLVAVGRRPSSGGLGLENTAVGVDDKGFIQIDAQCRTGEPTLFAIGDVAGEPMLAHKASHEARIAVEVIAGRNVKVEPAAVPAVVFTDPEVAWAGLSEAQAKANAIDYSVTRFPWAASGTRCHLGQEPGTDQTVGGSGDRADSGGRYRGPRCR